MQSHEDSDYARIQRARFLEKLEARAKTIKEKGGSQITAGAPGEKPLAQWEAQGVSVMQLPADPQKILRISIGGGTDLPIPLMYCTFRGDRMACIDLLRQALQALQETP